MPEKYGAFQGKSFLSRILLLRTHAVEHTQDFQIPVPAPSASHYVLMFSRRAPPQIVYKNHRGFATEKRFFMLELEA